ncbi:hydroxyproline-rich glycoprotein family protein [Euphorbia peplus]|nr:hydroxyproline-rich glycoprotein family protein [Euphorbia peplus]
MRGRSSKQDSKQGMELDKLKEEQPHLSGAYIRSLVKQLTSSRTKDTIMNHHPKDPSFLNDDGCSVQDMTISDTKNQPTQQQPQQHKKQVRRRLHTSRPYQERLLNMAEARREIVAALKFHRATMKEQQQQQQQQQQHEPQPSLPIQLSPSSCFEQEGKIKSRRNPRIYPSNSSNSNFSSYIDSISYTSLGPHAPPPPTSPPPYPYYWPNPPILPPENLNFPLPNQTLGLNLNFQDFNNLDTTLYHNPSSVYTSSSPSPSPSSFSSSSPSLSVEVAKFQEAGIGMPPCMVSDLGETDSGGGLHQVMDDDEMAEIRSIGEQHQMEWSDTMNLVQSAWWFKFLKTMESDPQLKPEDDPFEQVMEFPSWLNANEGSLQQHLDDYSSQDYYHDPSLPCMDIGEIEGMDGEWLA